MQGLGHKAAVFPLLNVLHRASVEEPILIGTDSGAHRHIQQRNKVILPMGSCEHTGIAVETATALGVSINDLWAIIATYPQEKFRDYAHLTGPAFEELGSTVADYLRRMLQELT